MEYRVVFFLITILVILLQPCAAGEPQDICGTSVIDSSGTSAESPSAPSSTADSTADPTGENAIPALPAAEEIPKSPPEGFMAAELKFKLDSSAAGRVRGLVSRGGLTVCIQTDFVGTDEAEDSTDALSGPVSGTPLPRKLAIVLLAEPGGGPALMAGTTASGPALEFLRNPFASDLAEGALAGPDLLTLPPPSGENPNYGFQASGGGSAAAVLFNGGALPLIRETADTDPWTGLPCIAAAAWNPSVSAGHRRYVLDVVEILLVAALISERLENALPVTIGENAVDQLGSFYHALLLGGGMRVGTRYTSGAGIRVRDDVRLLAGTAAALYRAGSGGPLLIDISPAYPLPVWLRTVWNFSLEGGGEEGAVWNASFFLDGWGLRGDYPGWRPSDLSRDIRSAGWLLRGGLDAEVEFLGVCPGYFRDAGGGGVSLSLGGACRLRGEAAETGDDGAAATDWAVDLDAGLSVGGLSFAADLELEPVSYATAAVPGGLEQTGGDLELGVCWEPVSVDPCSASDTVDSAAVLSGPPAAESAGLTPGAGADPCTVPAGWLSLRMEIRAELLMVPGRTAGRGAGAGLDLKLPVYGIEPRLSVDVNLSCTREDVLASAPGFWPSRYALEARVKTALEGKVPGTTAEFALEFVNPEGLTLDELTGRVGGYYPPDIGSGPWIFSVELVFAGK